VTSGLRSPDNTTGSAAVTKPVIVYEPQSKSLPRRLKTVPAVVLAAVVLLPLFPLLAVVAVLVDVVRLRFRLPSLRVLAFGAVYLCWELFALSMALVYWVASGFGAAKYASWYINVHRDLQTGWANSLLGAARVLLNLKVHVDNIEALTPGPVIVFSRHASMVDTIIPANLLDKRADLALRYVLKHELKMDPAIDVVGHRITSHFVDRSGSNTADELAAIGRLASNMSPNESFTIFPEGSRYTPQKRERALEKLRANQAVVLERAEALQHTMPPRTGGVLAILNAAPDVDVVIVAHTGLEGIAGVKDIWRAVPFRTPVQLTMWRVPAAEIPKDDTGRIDWIFAEWAKIDVWIAERRSADSTKKSRR
jgi:1-acyl-sn-glycerol-3-phosphate acyltransferase